MVYCIHAIYKVVVEVNKVRDLEPFIYLIAKDFMCLAAPVAIIAGHFLS